MMDEDSINSVPGRDALLKTLCDLHYALFPHEKAFSLAVDGLNAVGAMQTREVIVLPATWSPAQRSSMSS